MRRSTVSVIAVTACLSVSVAAPAAARTTSSLPLAWTIATPAAAATPVSLAAPAGPAASVADGAASLLQNEHADRSAMVAWAVYLRDLLADKRVSAQNVQAFTAQTNQTCRGALSPITKLTSTPAGWSTVLTNFGEEIGADATIAYNQSAAAPFAKLELSLSALHWAGAVPAVTVRRFLAAATTLLALTPSNLCADAFGVLAQSSSPATTTAPPTTTQLLSAYTTASATFRLRRAAFLKQLSTYETDTERAIVLRINTLTRRINALSVRTVTHGASALKLVLGVGQPTTLTRNRTRSRTTIPPRPVSSSERHAGRLS